MHGVRFTVMIATHILLCTKNILPGNRLKAIFLLFLSGFSDSEYHIVKVQ